ncbi:MAG: DUF1501 domain-containing protein [Pirellulaceae bacterium]|nr:DUF1501 domain-containing protein [Pirellulaceae bacterium]
MLKILTEATDPNCSGLRRRDFLRVGGLGLGGLALPTWLSPAARANPGRTYQKDKSVILLFLSGGPSQFETFDPKPEGPGTSTSIAGHIPTAIPGVRFASYLPQLADLADRLTIVRSFQTNHAEHSGAAKQLLTADLTVQDGKPIVEPGLGSVYARAAGAIHPTTGMPRHALIPPTTRHVEKSVGFAGSYEAVTEGLQPAWLGTSFAPLTTQVALREGTERGKKKSGRQRDGEETENPFLANLEPRVPDVEIDARLNLLAQLDGLHRRLDARGHMASLDGYREQAVELLRGGVVREALDLTRENPRTLAAYDTEHFRNYRCDERSKFERSGPSIGISLGRQLLLARRLCEAGAGFVTVIHSNWDFHARKNIPNIPEGMSVLAPPLDHAVAAFLADIRQRGLEDKILLVITGEFGRTPGLDENLGRHHWPGLCPLVFAGGGFDHGRVIGQSDRRGGEPADNLFNIADLHATVLQALFDGGQMRLDAALPAKIQQRAAGGRNILAS